MQRSNGNGASSDLLQKESEQTEKLLDNSKDAKDTQDSGISAISAAVLLMTWSTSSSNVMYPWTFGVLGAYGGPLLMLVAFSINWYCTRWTIKVARATDARTLGDVGEFLAGRSGRWILEGSQIAFQQLFLPVAIVMSAASIRSIAGAGGYASCKGNVAVLLAVAGFVLVQFSRNLEHMVGLAYFSVVMVTVQTIIIAVVTSTQEAPSFDEEDMPAAGMGGWEPFVGMGDHPERYKWWNVCGALGIFIYSCLPNCIVVEIMATMKPKAKVHMERAVDVSFGFYICVYLLTGLPAILSWGGDIPNPIMLSNDAPGVATKLILIYATMLDFVLASVTVNRALVRWWGANFSYRWTWDNALLWAGYSLPSSLLAVTMALIVPRLASLVGLLSSVTGTTLQITGICGCLLYSYSSGERVYTLPYGSDGQWNLWQRLSLWIVAVYGVVFTIVVFAEAQVNIFVLTDYTAGPNQTFWCDVVG